MIEVSEIIETNETKHAQYSQGIKVLDTIAKFLEDHQGYAYTRYELKKIIHESSPNIDEDIIAGALHYIYSFPERGIVYDADSKSNFDKDLFYFDKELKLRIANNIKVRELRESILENPEYLIKIKKFLDDYTSGEEMNV